MDRLEAFIRFVFPKEMAENYIGDSFENIAEGLERWFQADDKTKAEIAHFYEYGPKMISDELKRQEDGTPTTSELEDMFNNESGSSN